MGRSIHNSNFSIMKIDKVPEGATILPAVWKIGRKRDIKNRIVNRYKARLNRYGSRIKSRRDYY